MANESYRYRSARRAPSHPWPSWHNHTGCFPRFSFCPAAGLSVERYRAAFAQEAGAWESFAITDHAFSIAVPDPVLAWPHVWYDDRASIAHFLDTGIAQSRFEEYLEFGRDLKRDKRFYFGMEIELDFNEEMLVPREVLDRMDVVIASIHHNPGEKAKWVERHFFHINRLVKIGADIIGHPVRHLAAYSSPANPLPREVIDETLDLVQGAGMAIEINAHVTQLQDDVQLVRGAYERGMQIAFSLDLHYPEEFGNWRYFEDVVEQSGIPYESLNLFKPKKRK